MDRPVDRDLVEPRDEESLTEAEDAAQREAIRCTVVAYRRPDRLEVGDPVPKLELTVLSDQAAPASDQSAPASDTVDIAGSFDRPVMLIFGSYT
jgi:hypothetical protein